MTSTVLPPWRARLLQVVENRLFTRTITALIVINAVLLALETVPSVMAEVMAVGA